MRVVKTILLVLALLAPLFLPIGAAAAGEAVDERREVQPDGFVSVSIVRGTVRLRGWDREEVHVEGTLDEQTEEFIFEVDDDETRIEVKIEESRFGWFDSAEGSDLTISLPAGSRLEFSGVSTDVDARGLERELEIGVVSGDIYLDGGQRRVSLQTVSGDIELRNVDGRIEVATVSGDVESYSASGNVEYSTVSGSVFVEDGARDISIASVSGDIEVQAALLATATGQSISGDVDVAGVLDDNGSLEFETVSGSIRLSLDGEVSARFDLETGSGSIRNRLSDDKPRGSKYSGDESLRFSLGDGEGSVNLATHSGDITLGRR